MEPIDVLTLRTDLKMTQAELAAAVGVDQSTVSNWERGKAISGPARKILETLRSQPNIFGPAPSNEGRAA